MMVRIEKKVKTRVLLVEDCKDVNQAMSNYLKKLGYKPISYTDGNMAEEDIRNGLEYKIALFDLSIGNSSGNQLTRVSKQYNPKTPVIIISGYNNKPELADLLIVKGRILENLVHALKKYNI